jgi:hypothetical protein
MSKHLIQIVFLVLLSACTTAQPPILITFSPSLTREATFTPDPSATPSLLPTLVPTILFTPTPILYTVILNDTLIGIAHKFNITFEDLLAANPSIGSQPLTVGMVLTIPSRQEASASPTVTALPVVIQKVQCFPNADGSLWCLALIKNDTAGSLQNLSVSINLQSSDQTTSNTMIAFAPLDILPPGKSMPISAFFPAHLPNGLVPQSQVLTASILPASDNRYLPVALQNTLIEIDWNGLSALVSGDALIVQSSTNASRVWILAVAYDQDGNAIGFRRWESNVSLPPGQILSFDFLVASLGPVIDHVELLVEATK